MLPTTLSEREKAAFKENADDGGVDKRVCVTNSDGNPIPVEFTTGPKGSKKLDKFIGLTVTDGSEADLISLTVDANKIRELEKLILACTLDGIFRLLVDGQQILSGRTGVTSPNVDINLNSYENVDEGLNIVLKFKPRLASVQRSIEAYLTTAEKDK